MQISKCIKSAQNLIEFAFVLPILIFVTLSIFEVALFWQETNTIYNLNAEINANVALVDTRNMQLGARCPAADVARKVLESKDNTITTMNNPEYEMQVDDGREPFALYRFSSTNQIVGENKPQATLWVDCRNPFESGITTQIEFYHKTLVMKASIPRFDKPEPIVIIPDKIFIASPKLNTIRQY